MAEYLIAAQDVGAFKKGDIADVRANNALYGGQEGLPKFVILKVPEHLLKTHGFYRDPWTKTVDYEVLNHNTSLDAYDIRVFSVDNGSANDGGITRAEVESYLNAWNASVTSVSTNSVRFNMSIYDAATSVHFWDFEDSPEDIDDFDFSQFSYDIPTGEHVIDLDYYSSSKNPTPIEWYVTRVADDVISHSGTVIRMLIKRSTTLNEFKDHINGMLKGITVERFRYYFNDGVVDSIISQGGIVNSNNTEFMSYVQDKAV